MKPQIKPERLAVNIIRMRTRKVCNLFEIMIVKRLRRYPNVLPCDVLVDLGEFFTDKWDGCHNFEKILLRNIRVP